MVGAYSVWMFALFFYIIDVLGWRKWTLFFTVIGMNSITIYLAQRFIRFSYTSEAIFGGLAKLMPETAQPLVSAIAYIAVCWGFLYFLYRLICRGLILLCGDSRMWNGRDFLRGIS